MKKLLPVAILLLMACCKDPAGKDEKPKYFSLAGYFTGEAVRLRESGMLIRKTVLHNGSEETKNSLAPDWEQELKPFTDCDINKAAWAMSFRTDSTGNDSVKIITYTALEKKPEVRKVLIEKKGGQITLISISTEKSNSWFVTRQELDYKPDEGYRISGFQRVKLAEKAEYSITSAFQKPD